MSDELMLAPEPPVAAKPRRLSKAQKTANFLLTNRQAFRAVQAKPDAQAQRTELRAEGRRS